jgi:hypothetical protein
MMQVEGPAEGKGCRCGTARRAGGRKRRAGSDSDSRHLPGSRITKRLHASESQSMPPILNPTDPAPSCGLHRRSSAYLCRVRGLLSHEPFTWERYTGSPEQAPFAAIRPSLRLNSPVMARGGGQLVACDRCTTRHRTSRPASPRSTRQMCFVQPWPRAERCSLPYGVT